MNRTLIIRLCLIALFVIFIRVGWGRVRDDLSQMVVYFLIIGAVISFVVLRYVLPWFAEAVGTVVYSSGEEIRTDGGKAAKLIAKGDYEGAIAEHEKVLKDDPGNSFAVAEIAKICAERLKDPARAMQVLKSRLAGHSWPEDDSAFLRFRIVDVFTEHLHDFAGARGELETIMASFPNTRHSANARHRLNGLEQAEYKALQQKRGPSADAGPQAS